MHFVLAHVSRFWYTNDVKKAIFLLVMVFVLVAGLGSPQAVGANEPYSYEVTQQEKDEYYAAIRNCETPSLECLVRYTTRFVAIEWINDIAGQDIDKISGSAPTSSGPNGGAIGSLFGLMTSMYAHPPASSQTYVADLVNNAGFASPAYAQGLGFASLEPILNLWKTFRNVAYFFFILFFIVIGLMIMFRFKIGGQTAVTAQQAIPSVIVSLILVTFSYAIAGFMIDLMYVVMFLIVTIFANTLLVQNGVEIGSLVNMNIFQLAGTLFTASWGALPETSSMISKILEAITSNQSSALSSFVGMIGGITLSLVVSIAVLIGVFKLFFELLKSYFIIIVSVVTAPIVLMFGALPGRNVFWPWLKNIVGNLSAFPAVLLVVVLFYQLTNTAGASGGFMPPFLIGSGQAGIIGPVMGLAIILALPELVKKIKEVFGAGDGGFGAVIMGAAGKSLAAGEVGIPVVAAGAASVWGGGRALGHAIKNKEYRSPSKLWETVTKGAEITENGHTRVIGGAGRLGREWWNKGMATRRFIDRAASGRALDAENVEGLLARIAGQTKQEKPEPKKKKVPVGG